MIQNEIHKLAKKYNAPTGLSIGISSGTKTEYKPLQNRKKGAIFRDPIRSMAFKALKKAKQKRHSIVIY